MPSTTKPRPIIQKITFTKEDQEDIKSILEGKPNKYTKGRTPASPQHKMYILKRKYYGNFCHLCSKFPDYKVTYNYDGATLVERYCEQHLPKEF